jgi:hypothetical protein
MYSMTDYTAGFIGVVWLLYFAEPLFNRYDKVMTDVVWWLNSR